MSLRMITAVCFVLTCVSATVAQPPSGKIDLDEFAGIGPGLVAMRAAFAETAAICPEDHMMLRIKHGGLQHLTSNPPSWRPPDWHALHKTVDDETYLIEYSANNCRVDLSFRMQVLRGDSWMPLLVPKPVSPPNISTGDPNKAIKEWLDELLARAGATPLPKETLDRIRETQTMGWSFGRAATATGSIVFDKAPRDCFEALGEYVLNRSGITFSFPTDLPGNLNHFVIERADIDDDDARFYFVRDECRFEITIASAVLSDGRWVARAIVPPSPPR